MGILERNKIDSYDTLYLFGRKQEEKRVFIDKWVSSKQERAAIWIEPGEAIDLSFLIAQGLFRKVGYFSLSIEEEAESTVFFAWLEKELLAAEMRASDYADRGKRVFCNFWHNLSHLPSSYEGLSLPEPGYADVAIVCGASKTLEQEAVFLRALQDKAFILAGGSAIAALRHLAIEPHFIAGVDPEPSWERFMDQGAFCTPLVYQGRFSARQLAYSQGEKIVMPSASLPSLDSPFLSSKEPFDAGWSVVNFLVAFATQLQCKRIVIVGVDFCAETKRGYSSFLSTSSNDMLSLPLPGTDLLTKRDWMLSAEWLLSWIQNHPEIRWERGQTLFPSLRDQIAMVSWDDLTSLPSRDIRSFVHAYLHSQGGSICQKETIDSYRREVKESLQRAYQKVEEMVSLWAKHHPNLPFVLPDYVLLQAELEEELAYQILLLPVWEVWQIPILKKETHLAGKKLHELLFFKTTLESYLSEMQ